MISARLPKANQGWLPTSLPECDLTVRSEHVILRVCGNLQKKNWYVTVNGIKVCSLQDELSLLLLLFDPKSQTNLKMSGESVTGPEKENVVSKMWEIVTRTQLPGAYYLMYGVLEKDGYVTRYGSKKRGKYGKEAATRYDVLLRLRESHPGDEIKFEDCRWTSIVPIRNPPVKDTRGRKVITGQYLVWHRVRRLALSDGKTLPGDILQVIMSLTPDLICSGRRLCKDMKNRLERAWKNIKLTHPLTQIDLKFYERSKSINFCDSDIFFRVIINGELTCYVYSATVRYFFRPRNDCGCTRPHTGHFDYPMVLRCVEAGVLTLVDKYNRPIDVSSLRGDTERSEAVWFIHPNQNSLPYKSQNT